MPIQQISEKSIFALVIDYYYLCNKNCLIREYRCKHREGSVSKSLPLILFSSDYQIYILDSHFLIQKIVNCNSESQTLNAILCKRHDPTRVFNAIIQLSEANGNEVNIVSSNENFSDVTGHFVPCYLPDGKSFSDLSVKEILTAIFHL